MTTASPIKTRARLSAAAKRQLEAIVGARHVSDDPTVIASHAWVTSTGGDPTSGKQLYNTRPIAVVLPGSTEEVQAVVRACLHHNLKFRAHSTGHGSFAGVHQEGVVSLDLRRMDRIIEIDAKNQMAIIQPYVTAAQLQAEAMKVGLTTHIIGAGWTHSPLASATSLGGVGISGNHTGANARNLLCWEWITPEGELVRGGSAGAGEGAGWFSGDGPGPGFRGMIRGGAGAFGSLGVFTRIGYKLHPWAGPKRLEHRGRHPQLGIPLNDTMRLYQLVWDNWQAAADALFELNLSSAGTFIVRIPPDQTGWILYPTNREFYDRWTSGNLPELLHNDNRISWTVLAVSETPAEAQWRERTILQITAQSGGRRLSVAQEHAEVIARNLVTASFVPRAYRGGARQVLTSYGIFDSPAMLPDIVKVAEDEVRPYKEKYRTLNKGSPEEFWLWPSEGRSLWGEHIISGDNDNSKSYADAVAMLIQTLEDNENAPRGMAAFNVGPIGDIYGRHFGVNRWMARIKAEFDPRKSSDGLWPGYNTLLGRLWPLARLTVFKLPLLLRLMMRGMLKAGK